MESILIDSPIQVLAKRANQYIVEAPAISFAAFIAHTRQKNAKESFRAYLPPLLTLCRERHGGAFKEYKFNVFSAAPLIWQHPTHVFDLVDGRFHPAVAGLIISARKFSDKLAEITSHFNVPETKFLVDVPTGVTLGFLELADDFYTEYKAWEAPDFESMVGKLKRLIFNLYDSSFECEDAEALAVIRTTILNLCRELLKHTNADTMNSLNDELVERIKAGIINLRDSLGESQDVDKSIRMINRMRECLVNTNNLEALAEVDERFYTSSTARNA